MQSKIHKTKIILFISALALSTSNCNKKSENENQITIKINSIDEESKKRRVNMFDTLEVSKERPGLFTKRFTTERMYITDSMGSVKIKIDPTKIYDFSVSGLNVLGGDMYYPGFLKDGQEVNIEVRHYDKN